MLKIFIASFFALFCVHTASASDTVIYVSPYQGADAIYEAIRTAREYKRHQVSASDYMLLNDRKHYPSVHIKLAKGIYRLYQPLVLRPEDSNLIIEGEEGTQIFGSVKIEGWKKEGSYYVADVPEFNGRPIDFRQLWVNGVKADRARSVTDWEQMPRIINYDKKERVLWVPTNSVSSIMNAGQLKPGEHAELILHQMWELGVLRIKDIKSYGDSSAVTFHHPEDVIQFSHPWPSPMYHSEHDSPFYLANSLSLLDEPGEWFYDIRSSKLYYQPREGENMDNVDVEAPVLENLVEVLGSRERKVSNIRMENINFYYTSWMRPSFKGHVPLQAGMYLTEAYKLRPQINRPNNHKLDNQGWLGRARAAIEINYGDSIDIVACRIGHLGGSGVDYREGCHGGWTTDCIFRDIAMNGYVSGSFSPPALETHLPYQPKDTIEVCTYQQVRNNILEDIANEDWGCVAIAAGYVSNINIAHNNIHNVSYTAISLGWGWNRDSVCMHDNHVVRNTIYDYAHHMYDCAGIYTLGNQPGTVIERNSVRDIAKPSYVHDPNHWFYLYTDEGSSNITIRDNWTPEEKYLKNANGPGNVWENNGPKGIKKKLKD